MEKNVFAIEFLNIYPCANESVLKAIARRSIKSMSWFQVGSFLHLLLPEAEFNYAQNEDVILQIEFYSDIKVKQGIKQ